MNSQKLYITKILPHLKNFKMCEIYSFEIKKIEQQLAESLNKKNIHEALDIPDFRYVKDSKILPKIIDTAVKKLNLINEFKNEKYKLVTFSSGNLPIINYNNENLAFFMYQPDFKKIYYCGKLLKENIKNSNKTELFTDFENLEI